MHWRRKWQPTPVFLPGESQGRGSLMGCRLWGRTESDTTEATYIRTYTKWVLKRYFERQPGGVKKTWTLKSDLYFQHPDMNRGENICFVGGCT